MNTIPRHLATIFGWAWAVTMWLTLVAVFAWGGAFHGALGL